MKYENVSNATVLEDIDNTEREVEAYRMISEGYAIIARLPENTDEMNKIYAEKYNRLYNECRDFLGQLNKIKTERGL